jgi:enterochelin esterase-like enzyme
MESAGSLRERALASGTPLADGDGATFVWLGDADAVTVVGTWCDWEVAGGLVMERSGGAWVARLDLPADAYIEYALVVDGVRVQDPLNRHRVANGVGGRNEQLWMPAAPRRAEALRRRRVPRGTLTRHRLELAWWAATPKRRRLDLYLPPAPADRSALPLLVVLDGADYLDRGHLARILDALIHDGTMAPVAAAFIDNAGDSRGVEYAASDFTLESLASEVVPAAVERLGLRSQAAPDGGPGRAVILGSSMGGLMALHAAVRRPGLFGRAIVQSCAAFDEFEPTTIAWIRRAPPPPVRIWQDAGDYEWLAAGNDALAGLLEERGYDATYRRFRGGHDQTSWTESLVDALPAIVPPAGR